MISYAQNLEDVLLRRVFPDDPGFYIDAGANDPVFHSVTKRFYEAGWRGINVEPQPGLHARLADDRPEDVNLNVGLSDAEGTLTLYETPTVHGWSTFCDRLVESYRAQGMEIVERPIPVTTLARVCAEHVGDRPIAFLKVDVEGLEREVLQGHDWARWRPRVVLVENAWPHLWEPILLEADYLYAANDGLNRYYVRHEDPGLLPAFGLHIEDLHTIIAALHAQIADLQAQIAGRAEPPSPAEFAMAHRLRRMSHRFPRLSATARRLLRLAEAS